MTVDFAVKHQPNCNSLDPVKSNIIKLDMNGRGINGMCDGGKNNSVTDDCDISLRSRWRQYGAAMCLSIINVASFAAYTWTEPLLEKLLDQNSSPIPGVSTTEMTWAVSLVELGSLVTPILAGNLADRFGRKPLLILTAPIYVLSWFVLIFLPTVPALFSIRFLQGMALGITRAVLPVYLGEISHRSCRGVITTFYQYSYSMGVLFSYSVGPFTSYTVFTYLQMIPPVLFLLVIPLIPESPYYLMKHAGSKQALQSLKWLRGGTDCPQLQIELSTIETIVKVKSTGGWSQLFTTRVGRKAFLIVFLLQMLSSMTGYLAVLSYASETFPKSLPVSGDLFTILMGSLTVVGTLLSCLVIDSWGRRPILLLSSAGSAVCLYATCIYFSTGTENLAFLPIICLITYVVLTSFGANSLMRTYQAEVFPTAIRGAASGISSMTLTIITFLSLNMYLPIAESVGLYVNYFIFGSFAVLCGTAAYFVVPETKQMTFDEIQALL